MTHSRKTLVIEIKNQFPTIKKPEDYADIILAGIRLKAYDRASSKKRREFKNFGEIKDHIFNRAYNDLNLLIPIKNADRNVVVSSERMGLIFVKANQEKIVKHEQKLLFNHIVSDHHVKSIVIRTLQLNSSASIDNIERKMTKGNVLDQASIYDKVLSEIGKNGVNRKDYMGLRVVTTPLDHYYLSSKSKNIIEKSKWR